MAGCTQSSPADRLTAHLTRWLGGWPPMGPLTVVESPARERPGWDGRVHPALGVATPAGAVLSVPHGAGETVRAAVQGWRDVPRSLAGALGRPGVPVWLGTLRWTATP